MDELKIGGASLKIASHGFVGAKGPKGDKGDPGSTVKVGTVTTGEAGSMASVTNVGTDSDAVLNFTIPRGAKGDKGDQGTQGYKGAKGDKGDKGDPGERGPQGPKGDKGDRGDRGPQGYKGDPGEKGSTGDKGDKGERGERGLTGLQGPQGIQGIQGVKGDKGDKGDPGDKGDKGDPGDKGDKGDPGDERDFFFTPGDGTTTLEQVKAAIMAGKRACFLGTYTDDEGCTSTVLMSCSVCGNAETKYGGFFFLGREDFYEYFEYRSASNWDEPVSLSRYPSRDLQYMIEGLHTIGYVKYLVNENILPVLAFTDPVSGEFNLVPYTAADDNCVIFEGILRGKIYRAVAAGSDDDKLDFVVTQTPIVDPNTKVDKVAGKGLSSNDFTNALKSKLDGIDMSAKVDKSDTSVYDNASGGVSVQIQGTTKTVASQTDFTAQKQKTANLETTVGTSPASDETGLQLLSLLKEHANKMGGVVDIIAELPSDEIGLEIVSRLKDKTKLIKEIANNYEEAE